MIVWKTCLLFNNLLAFRFCLAYLAGKYKTGGKVIRIGFNPHVH